MSVRLGLLSLLDRGSMHGYQLRHDFEAATGSTWPLNVGQVYTTLARLERDALVSTESDADEAQRVYTITDAGHDEVLRWYSTPVSSDSPPRNELAIKLALAATTPEIDLHAVIRIQRSATMLAVQNYTRAREKTGADLAWQLVADSLIFAAEAEMRWLDHCEKRLIQSQRPTTSPTVATPKTEEVPS